MLENVTTNDVRRFQAAATLHIEPKWQWLVTTHAHFNPVDMRNKNVDVFERIPLCVSVFTIKLYSQHIEDGVADSKPVRFGQIRKCPRNDDDDVRQALLCTANLSVCCTFLALRSHVNLSNNHFHINLAINHNYYARTLADASQHISLFATAAFVWKRKSSAARALNLIHNMRYIRIVLTLALIRCVLLNVRCMQALRADGRADMRTTERTGSAFRAFRPCRTSQSRSHAGRTVSQPTNSLVIMCRIVYASALMSLACVHV